MNWAHLKENYGLRYSEPFPLTNAVSKLYLFDTVQYSTLSVPTAQNGQTNSNNSSANADEFFECV